MIAARALVAVALALVAACGERGEDDGRPELLVFAAASATDVVAELASGYADARVRTSFGASSDLARQIADGAPADVFVSASRRWIDHLDGRGALVGEPRTLARNALVCVVPPGSPLPSLDDASALAAALRPDDRVAIADAGVPAGEAARESLAATGDLEALRARLVGQVDVRAVLRAVAAGEAAAGFVYATDARAAAVELRFALDPATHAPVELVAAVVAGSRAPEAARAFLEHVAGTEGRAVLARHGFELP